MSLGRDMNSHSGIQFLRGRCWNSQISDVNPFESLRNAFSPISSYRSKTRTYIRLFHRIPGTLASKNRENRPIWHEMRDVKWRIFRKRSGIELKLWKWSSLDVTQRMPSSVTQDIHHRTSFFLTFWILRTIEQESRTNTWLWVFYRYPVSDSPETSPETLCVMRYRTNALLSSPLRSSS
jgi:hypothetical protein